MNQLHITRKKIIAELNALPPELLLELQTFMEYLRFKTEKIYGEGGEQIQQALWQTALEETFGMWADRDDLAGDGVAYVQNIRRGQRLDDLLEQVNEAD